jgi:hypothetical protein
MGNHLRAIQLLHAGLLVVGAAGFFVFWVRTRFWMPQYAHILAAIGWIVGLWVVWSVPSDAPLGKEGSVTKFLFALILPAMVYFFFVFYGGQHAAYRHKPKTAGETADLIDRFLSGSSLYAQEWNDFVERRHPDEILDAYRRRCEALDPRVNRSGPQDPTAIDELRHIVQELRGRSSYR